MSKPKLVKIDLTKGDLDKCEHPDIKKHQYYLAKIDGNWYADTFSKQWYGWNFNGVYSAGYQLSYGEWEELYEIRSVTE